MHSNCSRLYGSRASLSLLGALITFPAGGARRKYRIVGATGGGGAAGGGAGRPGSETGGGRRWVASPTSRRTSLANAAWRSCSVAVGPMQRNHSAVDVIGIDICGPPDVGEGTVLIPRIFCAPALRRGFSLSCASLARRVHRGQVVHRGVFLPRAPPRSIPRVGTAVRLRVVPGPTGMPCRCADATYASDTRRHGLMGGGGDEVR
jgi:hypothetical protein